MAPVAKRRSQLTSFTSGFHARCNRSDHHRGHLELVGAIDDAVTRGDPRKVGVDRPDRAGVVLSHQKSYRPIQTGIRIRRYELGAEWRIAEDQQRGRIELDAGPGRELGLVNFAEKP